MSGDEFDLESFCEEPPEPEPEAVPNYPTWPAKVELDELQRYRAEQVRLIRAMQGKESSLPTPGELYDLVVEIFPHIIGQRRPQDSGIVPTSGGFSVPIKYMTRTDGKPTVQVSEEVSFTYLAVPAEPRGHRKTIIEARLRYTRHNRWSQGTPIILRSRDDAIGWLSRLAT